jgi:hypothetical protein
MIEVIKLIADNCSITAVRFSKRVLNELIWGMRKSRFLCNRCRRQSDGYVMLTVVDGTGGFGAEYLSLTNPAPLN